VTPFNRIRTILVRHVVILLAPFVSVAQGFPDGDTREISSYVLTESALAKFTLATKNLGSLSKSAASHCDDEGDADSLNAFVARINRVPGAQAAIQSAGMTTAGTSYSPGPCSRPGWRPGHSKQPGGAAARRIKANVDFYRA
jgi:hypothetical protein